MIDSGTVSMMMNGIDEALELRRQHQIDEGKREQEGQVDAARWRSLNSRDWPL